MRRVPASLLKRLERVEQTRSTSRPRGGWPPICYDLDEWEAQAVASQAELVFLTREYIDREPVQECPQQQVNTQAEHERLYQAYKKQVEAGPREYLKHKQEQVKRATST